MKWTVILEDIVWETDGDAVSLPSTVVVEDIDATAHQDALEVAMEVASVRAGCLILDANPVFDLLEGES